MDKNIRARLEASVLDAMDGLSTPCEWGKDDCALWVSAILDNALGYDPALGIRGTYSTREGADKVLGKYGLPAMFRRMAKKYGWRRIHPLSGDSGDIGLAVLPALIGDKIMMRPTSFICRSPGWWVARSERGYFAAEAHGIRLAWAVV